MTFDTIERAIETIRGGGIVLVVDDADRENEGDLIMAAEMCTPELMTLFLRPGSGYVCAPMTQEKLDHLEIPMMVQRNTSRLGTAMTVTVDVREGTTTGVSAADRCATVLALARRSARPGDFTRPGHIVPLRAEDGGVLKRAGHTEAAVDLCRLAGLEPVGVLAEAMNSDGTMARGRKLQSIAKRFAMPLVTIASLIRYRRQTERLVDRVAVTTVPTPKYGSFTVYGYQASVEPKEAMALVKGDLGSVEAPLVRVHSSCITGDLLLSLRCDCGDQLHLALQRISDEGCGVLIYLVQEGRGIGVLNKLRAYALQDKGFDTVQANEKLGFKPDLRDYGIGAQIMADLGLGRIRLLTNNPAKVAGLDGFGLEIAEWLPLRSQPNPFNERYLRTKRDKLGHLFAETDLPPEGQGEPNAEDS
jgi:3,4-dihydroxy 2-butanone 4-phosphate synthase/GTP cyclohydrolase II